MVGSSSAGAVSLRLNAFLCHDLRDKKDTINESGQREKGIAIQLSEWLEAHNIDVWRSDKELAGGETWKRAIYDKAIPSCDLFIVCLTKNFVDATPGQRHREIIRALEIAETKHPDTTFILPIRIEQVYYPGLGEKQYINYYKHLSFDILLPSLEKKQRYLEGQDYLTEVAVPLDGVTLPANRAKSSGVWNVPYSRNPHFTGRDELLDRLDRQLAPTGQNYSAITRRTALIQPQAIKGLGGIGKTQIAVEYAYRSRDQGHYTHTLWVNAASEEMIITSYVIIAQLLPAFPAKNETDQRKLVEAVKLWLEQCEQRWLLIFDNIDNTNDFTIIPEYLPQIGNGSVLLTTRAHAVGSLATSIEVEKMGLMEGTQLLLHRAQYLEYALEDEINEATNVVIALDHFPLALDQAGAYIEETGCNFAEYLQIYQVHRKELHVLRGLQTTNYPDSVATTWSLSFQRVEQANPAAAELLRLFAFLDPDMIPEELIRESAVQWAPPLQQAAADLFAFNQMIAELLKFSLVKRLTETHTLSIHRLVQAVQKDMMEKEMQRQWAERVLRAVNDVFPSKASDVDTWSQCLRYLPQVQVCYTLVEEYALMLIEASNLLNKGAIYLWHHALYPTAEALLKRALTIDEQQLGAEHTDTITSLNNLALLYREQGQYEQAEGLFLHVLAISEQQLGPLHPDTAKGLSNLAGLYRELKKYEQAEPLFVRALAIQEQVFGSEDLEVAPDLNNLGLLYRFQRKYELAEQLYLRAISIFELRLGPSHPNVAIGLNNLALLYRAQGKYDLAEPLLVRALTIQEETFGSENLKIAVDLNNLALLYDAQGKYEPAEKLYLRAISIFEQQAGATHPRTQKVRKNYISLLRAIGRDKEAKQQEEHL